jgi:outer membrane autotransporter protein
MASAVVSVDEGATLTLSGDRVISEGSLSVGGTGSSSVDLGLNTLTLNNGGVNFASGTSINLTVSGASAYGRIVQAAADAVVDLGTIVNVNIVGYVPHGTVLKVVDGNGGSGVAGGLTVFDNDMIVSFIVSAVAGPDLILTAFVDYDPAHLGGSTASVAETLAIIEGQDVSLDMRAIFTELHNAASLGAVSHAVMQMRPYEGTAIVDQTRALSANGRRAAMTHLDMARKNSVNVPAIDQRQAIISSALNEYEDPMAEPEPDPTLQANIWAQGIGGDSDRVARSGVDGYSSLARGIIFGIDMLKMDTLLFGIASGYGAAEIDPDQFGIGSIDIKHYPLILYAELHGVTPWRVDALFSAARNRYRTTRSMRFGSIDRTASGVFNGQEYDLSVEGAYDLSVSAYKFTPSVSMDYSSLALDGYTESGADALDLTVKSAQYGHLRSGIGLAASTLWTLDRVRIVPEIYGKAHHEWLAPSIKTTAAFNGTDTYFQTTPMESARNIVETGMSWDFALPREMSLRFNYDAEFSQGYSSNILSAQFKSKF